jgi:hypothetical protein
MRQLLLTAIVLAALAATPSTFHLPPSTSAQGAWQATKDDMVITMVIADDYLASARYDLKNKKFYGTHGGRITSYEGGVQGVSEFDSEHKETVGKPFTMAMTIKGDVMKCTFNGTTLDFKRLDDGTKNLIGNWRITQRAGADGKLAAIHISGPRKTIKILSSTRFQWAAINTETGEFFGTGGGNYSFANGKYTENIEFFSRDSSRVGMALTFDGKLEGKDWYHSGKSSRGDAINEVWSRF